MRLLRHYFYIPRPRSHINLYIEYDFNYMKGARMSYLLWFEASIAGLEQVHGVCDLQISSCKSSALAL